MNVVINLVAFSGGGVRIDILLLCSLWLKRQGIQVQAYSGVSSGALAALAAVFSKEQEILDFLAKHPTSWIKKRGANNAGNINITGFWRLITFRRYLSEQDEASLIKRFISEEEWEAYRQSDGPDVWIYYITYETRVGIYKNIKELSYDEMLFVMTATCRVPFHTKLPSRNGLHYLDGGIEYHNPSPLLVAKYPNAEHLYSFYTEVKGKKVYSWPLTWIGIVMWLLGFFSKKNSQDDMTIEKLLTKSLGIKRTAIRLEDYYKSPYDLDRGRSEASRLTVKDQLKELG